MHSVILTTAGSKEEAEKIADAIIKDRKAACIQCMPIESFYFWEGKVNNDPEILMLIKTRADLFEEVKDTIIASHSYDLPEIIQLDITNGLPGYLSWITEETNG